MIISIDFKPIDDLLETGWKGTRQQIANETNIPLNKVQIILSQHSVGDNAIWKVKNGIISHRTPNKTKQSVMFNG